MSTIVTPERGVASPPARPALDMRLRRRLAMVAIGYVPFLNLVAIISLAVLPSALGWPRWTMLAAVAWLLVVPPLVVRVALLIRPLPSGDIPINSPAFLLWWFTSQWQVIFNRLPWIEETVRLVPGAYSAWLRLWGARVGRFVYWTPGLRILDRPLVDVGSRVVFGVGVRVNPHVLMPDDAGRLALRVGTVRIGDDALVGGYSILFAGCWVAPGEATPGKREHRPFTGWANGRRVLPDDEKQRAAATVEAADA
jgi:hypothetical protein